MIFEAPATPSWMSEAVCASVDPVIFFPKQDDGRPYAAISICNSCPVQSQCLEYALEFEAENPGTRYGVYGGLSPNQRKALGRRRTKAAA